MWLPLLGPPSLGCAGSQGQAGPAKDPLSHVTITAVDLDEGRVAHEIKRLLSEPEATPERLNRLASVTRAQLNKAGRYFGAGREDAAMRTTMGTLFLIRSGEHRPELFTGSAATLLQAAGYVARLGDEGRALAFYELAGAQLQPGRDKAEVERHLSALSAWQGTANEPGTMQGVGARHESALNEALVSCTRENLKSATSATVEWLNRAIVEGQREAAPTTYFEHDERMEARRAVMTAALGLSALYLRDGDAGGALVALQTEPIASASSEKLVARLEGALDGNAEAWADLFGWFESAGDVENGALSRELSRGASFGAAVALYRLEPGELRAAIPLSTLLVEHGMADVAPLILSEVVTAASDPRELDWVLRLVFGALSRAADVQDIELSRRVFDNARPILDLPVMQERTSRDSPAVADFYYVMGALEARAGHLDRARPYLENAVARAPTRDALRLLAAIDRQRGAIPTALQSVQGIQALARSEGDKLGEARALLLAVDLRRAAGQNEAYAQALSEALQHVLAARAAARLGTETAVAETVLADILERYGELEAASRASLRAYEAAQNDLGRLTMTLLDASRRALTFGDLAGGRLALRRAVEVRLDADDLIYVALWTRLLEQRANVTSDGSVEEALLRIDGSLSWTGALRDWARRAMSDAQLMARARDPVQKAEAEFYVVMSQHARSDAAALASALEGVATSSAVELIEVRVAQDLIALTRGYVPPPVPAGAEIP